VGFAIKAQIDGLGQVLARLQEADKKVRRKLLRQAVNEAGKIVLAAAKARVPKGATGQLRRSLGRKVKVYRSSGTAVAIVGPRKGYKIDVDGRAVDPVHYAHLVEYGRRAAAVKTRKVLSTGKVVFGRKAAAVPAHPFMRPALDSTRDAVRQAMTRIILEGLEAR